MPDWGYRMSVEQAINLLFQRANELEGAKIAHSTVLKGIIALLGRTDTLDVSFLQDLIKDLERRFDEIEDPNVAAAQQIVGYKREIASLFMSDVEVDRVVLRVIEGGKDQDPK